MDVCGPVDTLLNVYLHDQVRLNEPHLLQIFSGAASMNDSRRSFLTTAVLSTVSVALDSKMNAQMQNMAPMNHNEPKPKRPTVPRLPALICKATGTAGIDAAYKMLLGGGDTLDAVLHVCKTQEDDPKDHSTGLGALPNAQGQVQLDACCLHGPTRRGAAIGSVSGIRNASLLARALMDETGNALLVGSDAQAFALTHGFTIEDLLTERSRLNYALWEKIWMDPNLLGSVTYDPNWPEPLRRAHFMPHTQKDFDLLVQRCEPLAVQAGFNRAMTWRPVSDVLAPASQAIYVSAIDRKGELSSACTSGGRPWRIPGISSDVATIGAGCFLDPDVGSAGASGNAEASIKIAGANTIVENMRTGMSPEDAGMDALRRIVRWYKNDMQALRFIEVVYYVLRKDGAYASVSLWGGDTSGHVRQFTIVDAEDVRRTEECVALFPSGPMHGSAALHV